MPLKPITEQEFLERSYKAHGDRYNYSNVDWVSASVNVTIICSEHGEFSQRPSHHYSTRRAHGCPRCAAKRISEARTGSTRLQYSTSEFINLCRERHGDRYDYSKVVYTGSHNSIVVICLEHGEFIVKATQHMRGTNNCTLCRYAQVALANKKSVEYFLQRSKECHGDLFDYSKVDYVDTKTKVTIICLEHGEFSQKPSHHYGVHGNGCPMCKYKNVNFGQLYHPFPTMVYYIKISYGGNFYWKVGITMHDLKVRFGKQILDDYMDVIWTKQFVTGEPAWMMEQFILHRYNNSRIYKPDITILNGGWTEIFGSDVASDMGGIFREFIKEVYLGGSKS